MEMNSERRVVCLCWYVNRRVVNVACTCCIQLKELPTLDDATQFCSRLQTLKPAPVRTKTTSSY